MKKYLKMGIGALMLTAMLLGTAGTPEGVYASETQEQTEQGDSVEITLDDRPYLALGGDLSADQQHKVLEYMGIEAADFDRYDVVYVSNEEEHKYLDAYISKKKIGTHALSSVLVSQKDEGNGLNVRTYNINYCTAGMYKNALATAGVKNADVIVAAPFPISGTAALVGTLEAYEKLTGNELNDAVVDAAMDELVTTGELEQSINAKPEEVEAMIADLKGQMAEGKLKTPEQIKSAIESYAKEHHIKLSDEDKEKLSRLLEKLKNTDVDWDSIIDQADAWKDKLKESVEKSGIWESIQNFFAGIREWFESLF